VAIYRGGSPDDFSIPFHVGSISSRLTKRKQKAPVQKEVISLTLAPFNRPSLSQDKIPWIESGSNCLFFGPFFLSLRALISLPVRGLEVIHAVLFPSVSPLWVSLYKLSG